MLIDARKCVLMRVRGFGNEKEYIAICSLCSVKIVFEN